MFAVIKVASLIYSTDRAKTFRCPAGYMGDIPEWVTKTDHFKELEKAGLAAVTKTSKDKETQAVAEKPVKKAKTE